MNSFVARFFTNSFASLGLFALALAEVGTEGERGDGVGLTRGHLLRMQDTTNAGHDLRGNSGGAKQQQAADFLQEMKT